MADVIRDLLTKVFDGSPMGTIVIAVIAVFFLRGNAGGGIADSLLEMLGGLFNRQRRVVPVAEPMQTCQQKCAMLTRLASSFAMDNKPALAKKTLDLMSEVHKAHGGDDGNSDDHNTPTS
tara:strand:- start:2823 stop:3182 length:360 start_codon:yes stop_codon:yes gene_type:complete